MGESYYEPHSAVSHATSQHSATQSLSPAPGPASSAHSQGQGQGYDLNSGGGYDRSRTTSPVHTQHTGASASTGGGPLLGAYLNGNGNGNGNNNGSGHGAELGPGSSNFADSLGNGFNNMSLNGNGNGNGGVKVEEGLMNGQAKAAIRKKLASWVGFSNLPNQVHRRSVRSV